jgi:hypothetical protein
MRAILIIKTLESSPKVFQGHFYTFKALCSDSVIKNIFLSFILEICPTRKSLNKLVSPDTTGDLPLSISFFNSYIFRSYFALNTLSSHYLRYKKLNNHYLHEAYLCCVI